ncbi:MAG: Rpn family recombination-promoting nuclease/putative transposase [Rhodopirellula sp.]|nr:Rpn family recombination-promoting nuclease/putative transposase [Rhodopirellula sp.]
MPRIAAAGGNGQNEVEEPLALAFNRGFHRASPAAAGSMETKEPQNIEQGMSKEEGGGNRREFSFAAGYSLFDILRFMDFGIHLLNAILKPDDAIVDVEILNPFNEKDFVDDKLSVLDVKARDQAGRLVDVEMQMLLPLHFRSRILYYWAALYGRQLGDSDQYDRLRPTISVCFVNQSLFPSVKDYHLKFGLFAREHGLRFTDHIQIHLMELPKFNQNLQELRDAEARWLYFLRHAATLDADNLPAPLDEPIYRKATKELAMLNTDTQERERYESRQKAFRDQMSLLQEAKEQGREEGIEEGRQQGLQEGLLGRMQFCQRLLKRPVTSGEELSGVSLEELRSRVEELEVEVFRS